MPQIFFVGWLVVSGEGLGTSGRLDPIGKSRLPKFPVDFLEFDFLDSENKSMQYK